MKSLEGSRDSHDTSFVPHDLETNRESAHYHRLVNKQTNKERVEVFALIMTFIEPKWPKVQNMVILQTRLLM